jgi:glycosyltransferase involved in cell wall biosynthesis
MSDGRKRVLFLLPSLITGGAQRVSSILLRHLDRRRFELHLALLQAEGAYLKDVPPDVIIHELKVSRMRYAAPAIVRVVRRLTPATVLSTLQFLNVSLLAVKRFLPRSTRLVIREPAMASAFLENEVQYPRLWRWAYRRFYPRADQIVCLSQAMIADLEQQFAIPRSKLVCIYNPVDAEQICKSAEQAGNPYRGPGPHLVTVGRICHQKAHDLLISAMPAVLKQMPSATLTIVGDGPLADELRQQAQRLGISDAVCFAGFQANPYGWLKHATLFVLPSRYEGMPNALLEALALGTPVLATDCPGAIRELRDSDLPMALVPPEDAEALTAAIISAVDASAGHTPAQLSQFTVPRIVEKYSELL